MIRKNKIQIMLSTVLIAFIFFTHVLGFSKKGGSHITKQQVNEAVEEAILSIESLDDFEIDLCDRDILLVRGSAASYHHTLFRGDPLLLSQNRFGGLIQTETVKNLIRRLNLTGIQIRQVFGLSLSGTRGQAVCPNPVTCVDPKYRSLDGSCNNMDNLSWGKSFTALQRLMEPSYDDNVDSPRLRSVDGSPLPNPRLISSTLSPEVDAPSSRFTSILMQWGQFLDHDMTNTALTRLSDGEGITCCNAEVLRNASLLHPACLPITIPENDYFFAAFNQSCMEFVRSAAAGPGQRCALGQRQQLNMLTAFIDGSMIYGNTLNDSLRLRTFEAGRLRSSDEFGERIMPSDNTTTCNAEADVPPCFLAGDLRANEQAQLAVFHQIWFREHNRIAGVLKNLNQGWNDETLYQETRKIVGAMIQHITYNEFLPLLLGPSVTEAFSLNLHERGMTFDYDARINPSISNAFSTAAYRLGHSLVQGRAQFISRYNEVTQNRNLSTLYFSTEIAYRESTFDMVIRGMAGQPAQSLDNYLSHELTNHLFRPPGQMFGLDLMSLNIQRGRDHGLPAYNDWRELCNLPRLSSFEDLYKVMNPAAVDVFRRLYRQVDDIDLFPAGISELPIYKGAILGPTFACLVGEQFKRLKVGDRFWYENGNMVNSFDESQLNEIRKVTLSRVLCDNSNIKAIQKNAFLKRSCKNRVESCVQGNIPRMSLHPWKNEHIWYRSYD